MSGPLTSAVYEGVVRHRRHAPHPHAFGYRMAQLYLDLDEIDSVFDRRWLWSSNRRNLAEFRRSDFLGEPNVVERAPRIHFVHVHAGRHHRAPHCQKGHHQLERAGSSKKMAMHGLGGTHVRVVRAFAEDGPDGL